jgi:hypothetical protein
MVFGLAKRLLTTFSLAYPLDAFVGDGNLFPTRHVKVQGRLPWRQRHFDRSLGQPDGGRTIGTSRRAVSVHDIHLLRLPDDAGVDRHLSGLRLVAQFLTANRQPAAIPGKNGAAPLTLRLPLHIRICPD